MSHFAGCIYFTDTVAGLSTGLLPNIKSAFEAASFDACVQPLPVRAAVDVLTALAQPKYHALQLWVSCFEIYGGKVYDLLNARKRLEVREDAKKKVCIVGLKDFQVLNVRLPS